MKSIDAIYKFGNLYDKATRKRVLIEDGSKIAVVVNSANLLEEDPNIKPEKLLTPIQMAEAAKAHAGANRYWKVFDAGKVLYFFVSGGVNRKHEKENIQCLFQVKLLEDLY